VLASSAAEPPKRTTDLMTSFNNPPFEGWNLNPDTLETHGSYPQAQRTTFPDPSGAHPVDHSPRGENPLITNKFLA
jgi:hypothetical protein